MNKLSSRKLLCALLNNAVENDVFISIVQSFGRKNEMYFTNASYDTLKQCEKYIRRFLELFPYLQNMVDVFIEEVDKIESENGEDFFEV